MTYETNEPQDTKIHKLAISDDYKENALNLVKKMVKGNKFNPNDIKLEKFEGEILHFQAENMLTILTKITQKRVPGRIEGPIAVDNEIAAKVAMTNSYHALSQDRDMERQIRDVLLTRDDRGFALDNNIIPLPFWKKEFVIFEPCLTCKTTGEIKCHPCAGKGINLCPRCNGAGTDQCTYCNGAQRVSGPNGNDVSCPTCRGQGEMPCSLCNQTGRVQCKTCASKGITPCPNCQGLAWSSNMHTLEIEAQTAFDYPKTRLPEKVTALIEKHGVKIREHADIDISQAESSSVNVDNEKKEKEHAISDKNKDYRIPIIYEVFLPYAHIEYNIDNKSYYTFLFGKQGRMIHASPFLDILIKNGVRKLCDAAEMRGDVLNNLKHAAEYRTIKEGIFYTATNSLGKARAMLKKSNKLGLSDDAIKNIITQADRAIKNVTMKPRTLGLAFSGFLNLTLFSIYFLLPVRNVIISNIANQDLHIVCDILALIVTLYLGVITIQTTAHSVIKNVMNSMGIKKSAVPKLGNTLYWTIGLSIFIFMAVLEISRTGHLNPPTWYLNIFLYFDTV